MCSICYWACCKIICSSTLNVQGLTYLSLTRSISWLLMPWLLVSPGHQHPWYWLCRIGQSLSYLRKDFNYLGHVNVEEWHKCIYIYMFLFILKNLAHRGLSMLTSVCNVSYFPVSLNSISNCRIIYRVWVCNTEVKWFNEYRVNNQLNMR